MLVSLLWSLQRSRLRCILRTLYFIVISKKGIVYRSRQNNDRPGQTGQHVPDTEMGCSQGARHSVFSQKVIPPSQRHVTQGLSGRTHVEPRACSTKLYMHPARRNFPSHKFSYSIRFSGKRCPSLRSQNSTLGNGQMGSMQECLFEVVDAHPTFILEERGAHVRRYFVLAETNFSMKVVATVTPAHVCYKGMRMWWHTICGRHL